MESNNKEEKPQAEEDKTQSMINPDTGKEFTPEELREAQREQFIQIRTYQLNNVNLGTLQKKQMINEIKLAQKHAFWDS